MTASDKDNYLRIVNLLYEDWGMFHNKENETFIDSLPYNPLKDKLTLNLQTDKYELK
jgi:hypothetical protein